MSSSAFAQEVYKQVYNQNAGFFEVREVHIERLSVHENLNFLDYKNDCSDLSNSTDSSGHVIRRLNGEDLTLDQITNIGKDTWEFIQNNKPVINATTQYAHALPRGSACWDDLSNWQRPRSEVYKATYVNGFGMEVVNLEIKLLYTYGGQANNKGRYISNATLLYNKLDVTWGFKVDAAVEVPLVVNMGSKEDPVAGMQLTLRWAIKGVNHLERTAGFFVYGDGRPTEVL